MNRPVKPITRSHPCVFTGSVIREEIDPQVKILWVDRFGGKVPFGALRQMYREMHCATINPYDSTFCPYSEEECAMSFLACVAATVVGADSGHHARGYFRAVAHSRGLERADNKPLSRERHEAIVDQAQAARRPGDARGQGEGHEPGHGAAPPPQPLPEETNVMGSDGMRRRLSRPEHIGSLLGSFDFGPRPRPTDDGEAGTER